MEISDFIDSRESGIYSTSSGEEEQDEKQYEAKMATLVKEEDIEKDSRGRLLLNGLFAVHHKRGQRAIFDLRPANFDETRLRWCRLWMQLDFLRR